MSSITYAKALELIKADNYIEYSNDSGKSWNKFLNNSLVNTETLFRQGNTGTSIDSIKDLYEMIVKSACKYLNIKEDMFNAAFPTVFRYENVDDEYPEMILITTALNCFGRGGVILKISFQDNVLRYPDGKYFYRASHGYEDSIRNGSLKKTDEIWVETLDSGSSYYDDKMVEFLREYALLHTPPENEFVELTFTKEWNDDVCKTKVFAYNPLEDEVDSFVKSIVPTLLEPFYNTYKDIIEHTDEYLVLVNNMYEHNCAEYKYSLYNGHTTGSGVVRVDTSRGCGFSESMCPNIPYVFEFNSSFRFWPKDSTYSLAKKYKVVFTDDPKKNTDSSTFWYGNKFISTTIYGDGTLNVYGIRYFTWLLLMVKFNMMVSL